MSLDGALVDGWGRRFDYLRLSVTDACNFRCVYCLPSGFKSTRGAAAPLSVTEIGRLLLAAAGLGVFKVRLTGGEPTLRQDLPDIVATAAETRGVRKVALSTNGYRLAALAEPLARAGLSQVNVSVDHLRDEGFAAITGTRQLGRVLEGLEAALSVGLTVKVNVVRLAGLNDDALTEFLAWVREVPVTVRFIELMQTAGRGDFFEAHHVPLEAVAARLTSLGFTPRTRLPGDGPATEYRHPAYAGGIGLIAPYGPGFCAGCNRLRVTARGGLRLCLFGQGEHDLRPALQGDSSPELLGEHIRAALRGKTAGHRLHDHDAGETAHLAAVGG